MRLYDKYRSHPRYPVDFAVRLLDGETADAEVAASNISAGGLQVEVPWPVRNGERLEVAFPADDEETTDIEAVGEVRWRRRIDADRHVAGLKFVDISAADRARLEERLLAPLERRRDRRVPIRLPVETRRLDGEDGAAIGAAAPTARYEQETAFDSVDAFAEALGHDLSLTGMRIGAAVELAVGETVRLTLTMRSGHPLLETDAVVRWCRAAPYGDVDYEAGVEFLELSDDARDFLRSVVNAQH